MTGQSRPRSPEAGWTRGRSEAEFKAHKLGTSETVDTL
jgi:hypothetical protein